MHIYLQFRDRAGQVGLAFVTAYVLLHDPIWLANGWGHYLLLVACNASTQARPSSKQNQSIKHVTGTLVKNVPMQLSL